MNFNAFSGRRLLVALSLLCFGAAAWASLGDSPCDRATQGIPARGAEAPAAHAFVRTIASLGDHERDSAIRGQLLAGNLPDFLRKAVPVVLDARLAGGRAVRLTLCVLNDYLSVGSDKDYLRVPVGLETAMTVAQRFGFMLPTRRLVDLIYRQASVKLAPQPLPPGNQMRSADYLLRHEAMVQQQRELLGAVPQALTAGHKKDLVLTDRLLQQPGRVAIYGWHRPDGRPIQPLSTVHGERYADYSHGVRLVSQTAWVDGQPRPLLDVLTDPVLAPALSDEGPLKRVATLVAATVVR